MEVEEITKRNHWGIENKLHCRLDVQFKEAKEVVKEKRALKHSNEK